MRARKFKRKVFYECEAEQEKVSGIGTKKFKSKNVSRMRIKKQNCLWEEYEFPKRT